MSKTKQRTIAKIDKQQKRIEAKIEKARKNGFVTLKAKNSLGGFENKEFAATTNEFRNQIRIWLRMLEHLQVQKQVR